MIKKSDVLEAIKALPDEFELDLLLETCRRAAGEQSGEPHESKPRSKKRSVRKADQAPRQISDDEWHAMHP